MRRPTFLSCTRHSSTAAKQGRTSPPSPFASFNHRDEGCSVEEDCTSLRRSLTQNDSLNRWESRFGSQWRNWQASLGTSKSHSRGGLTSQASSWIRQFAPPLPSRPRKRRCGELNDRNRLFPSSSS